MSRVIAVANQKGGVGKTTTCVNLTAALHQLGFKVLLCDLDPQGQSTSGTGADKNDGSTIYDVICGNTDARGVVRRTDCGDVIAANKTLAGAEIELVGVEAREKIVREALEPLRSEYDFIILDCPASLGLITLNALCAADGVLVPVQCEYFALEGLADLMYTLRLVRSKLNPSLELDGILLTMYDSRTNLSAQVAEEVKRHFPGKLFSAVIPRNVRLSEAPSFGRSIFDYDRTSRGAEAYLRLAGELARRFPGQEV